MNEESLFAAALERSGAEREAFLDAACGGDFQLRRRVERLLAADGHPPGILERGPEAPALPPRVEPATPLVADAAFADQFRLVRKVGEGGMGEVWVAEQTEPVRRLVALKVIRPGLDSARLVARFDQERQALAIMDHPNIARVLDAGVTGGRPFFVMELIEGVPITRYCDDAGLTPRQRLELFIPVCHAVQHAHQKGIIHRDIKPSNILVATFDGRPVPKVIDFGVAKAIGPRLGGPSVTTEVGTLVGTLEYMSPEQADLNGPDTDTRSDVYALGVVLYELLTGELPFPREQLRAARFTEMLRMIKEVEPPRPTDRLRKDEGGGTKGESAARRGCRSAFRLRPSSFQELDWIVMKCLEKQPSRRYETANALADDLRRYLADEPVMAGPPSAGYRFRKFVRRHRGPAVAAGLVLLALVGGITGTTIGLVRAERARQAEAERAEGERQANLRALARLAQLEKGIDVLGAVFDDLDPDAEEKEGRPLRAILGDRLDRAAVALEGEEIADPLTVARLQEKLARTYLSLGRPDRAEALSAKALATCQHHLGPDHSLTVQTQHNLALAYRHTGKRDEAIVLFEQVREAQVKEHGPDHPATLTTLNNLAWTYRLVGKPDEAVALLTRVREARENRHGPNHPDTLDAVQDLAGAYLAVGRGAEAVELLKGVRDERVKRHGPTHPRSIAALNNLAFAYQTTFKMRLALELLEEARRVIVPELGPDHPHTLTILNNLAWVYRSFRRTDEAIELGEKVLARRLATRGPHHPQTVLTLDNLALAYQDAGKADRALALFRQAGVGLERLKFAQDDADRIVRNLCRCLDQQKRSDEAEAWVRKWVAGVKQKDGPESPAYAAALVSLGSRWLGQGRYTDAESALREALAIGQKKFPHAPPTFEIQSLLGAALLDQNKYPDAEPLLVQGYEGLARSAPKLPPGHPHFRGASSLSNALERLVRLYDAWGKPEKATGWRKKLEGRRPRPATRPQK